MKRNKIGILLNRAISNQSIESIKELLQAMNSIEDIRIICSNKIIYKLETLLMNNSCEHCREELMHIFLSRVAVISNVLSDPMYNYWIFTIDYVVLVNAIESIIQKLISDNFNNSLAYFVVCFTEWSNNSKIDIDNTDVSSFHRTLGGH